MGINYVLSSSKKSLWSAVPLGVVIVVLGSGLRGPPQFELASSSGGVQLGTAGTYSVIAGTTVTNTGATTLAGDLGLAPGSSVAGFPPGIVSGSTNVDNSAATNAQSANTSAYLQAAGLTPATPEVANLAGLTLSPGIYSVPAGTSNLTGTLTLDGQGNPNAIFVFQLPSTLITSSSSTVVLTNSANPCNIFWQVTSSATLGTGSVFAGTVLALTSISADTGATIDGRLLAQNGAVTLDTNTITNPICLASTTTTSSGSTTTTSSGSTTTTSSGSTTTTSSGSTTTTPTPLIISTGPPAPPSSFTGALPLGFVASGLGLTGLGYLALERKRRRASDSSNKAA